MRILSAPLSDHNTSGQGAIVLFVFLEDTLPEGILSSGEAPIAEAMLHDSAFQGKKGRIAKAPLPGFSRSPLYLVGLGERKGFEEDSLRSRTAELVRRARADGVSRLSAALPFSPSRSASCAVAEGAELGNYAFEKYKTRGDEGRGEELLEFRLIGGDEEGLSLGKMLACSQNTARDLANEPGNRSNPLTLAEFALGEARDFGLEAEVWDEKKIAEEGMEGLYSVGMGSATPPRLVRLSWKPEGAPLRKVVFVGKGITFDSGGLNLKPTDFLRTMKGDKSGACNVFALVRAAAKMKLPVEVHGIVALAENMPGGKAFRPDDILRMKNGKTVEIDNTDAEGRIVLADALCYASELRPDVIIDMATLTGACAVALGTSIAGLFSPDDGLAGSLLEAGKARGERLWRLPDDDERIAESMKSPVADLVNSGSRYGGAIFAARFLREFVADGISWAHLDIAGVDFNKEEYSVYSKGASGFGVRTCLQYLLSIR